jgi:exonuclease III
LNVCTLCRSCWETLGTARIIAYAKDDLKVKHLYPQDASYDHIQNISLEVGFGRAKKHICNFYYREWTSCKNKRKDLENQKEDLDLLLDIWRNCNQDDKDFVALGDMNLCAKKWDEPSYQHKDLANSVKDFMSEENCSQVIDNYTRIR